MRLLCILSAFGTALVASRSLHLPGPGAHAKRDGGFLDSCSSITFESSTPVKLSAGCSSPETSFAHITWLDLNHCLANSYGTLVERAEGNFALSCTNVTLDVASGHLSAECGKGTSNIDLTPIVSNQEGVLTCLGIQGGKGYDQQP
ncbi:hypothetical protein GGR57DRAFT_488040 [Xylariaceae sp. FL1272]|nr:hypothetical protein GGR57DRAFT_488040 [Xylariaceae sp. FL1272]